MTLLRSVFEEKSEHLLSRV
jgi:hypoxia up-regulated 1